MTLGNQLARRIQSKSIRGAGVKPHTNREKKAPHEKNTQYFFAPIFMDNIFHMYQMILSKKTLDFSQLRMCRLSPIPPSPLRSSVNFMKDVECAESQEKSYFRFFELCMVKLHRKLTILSRKMTISQKLKIAKIWKLISHLNVSWNHGVLPWITRGKVHAEYVHIKDWLSSEMHSTDWHQQLCLFKYYVCT